VVRHSPIVFWNVRFFFCFFFDDPSRSQNRIGKSYHRSTRRPRIAGKSQMANQLKNAKTAGPGKPLDAAQQPNFFFFFGSRGIIRPANVRRYRRGPSDFRPGMKRKGADGRPASQRAARTIQIEIRVWWPLVNNASAGRSSWPKQDKPDCRGPRGADPKPWGMPVEQAPRTTNTVRDNERAARSTEKDR